jgi:hypothetical protein
MILFNYYYYLLRMETALPHTPFRLAPAIPFAVGHPFLIPGSRTVIDTGSDYRQSFLWLTSYQRHDLMILNWKNMEYCAI